MGIPRESRYVRFGSRLSSTSGLCFPWLCCHQTTWLLRMIRMLTGSAAGSGVGTGGASVGRAVRGAGASVRRDTGV